MRIGIITPAPPRSRSGNRVTALRWAGILRKLGHKVTILQGYDGEPYDLLIALHARRSRRAIARFRGSYPDRPIITALTGTDLYRDLTRIKTTQESLEAAFRIVALQPKALVELRRHLRRRVRVIYQSVATIPGRKIVLPRHKRHTTFDICVIGHLRPVKDPFRAALAARRLPASSRVRVLHLGSAMTVAMERRARTEMKVNPRYRWLGEQPRRRVLNLMAQSDLCVLSSRMEGGANVLSEAIVAGVPLLASRIPGSVGILGENYPGYFAVGDTDGLARLLMRAESDAAFLDRLRAHCRKLVPLFHQAREEASWRSLLAEL